MKTAHHRTYKSTIQRAKELGLFVLFVLVVWGGSTIFMNLHLFWFSITDTVGSLFGQTHEGSVSLQQSAELAWHEEDSIDGQLRDLLGRMPMGLGSQTAPTIQESLKHNLDAYHFQFNLLPPDSRLLIPSIDVNLPIVSPLAKDMESFEQGDYDKELYSGIVKYPTTPDPGSDGAVFLFGHTSYYRWKNNEFGMAFTKIPKLKAGDQMQVVRHGQLYTYTVTEKKIVAPNKVKDEYFKHTDGKKLILMGCYPIGKDTSRILIIGSLTSSSNSFLATR